MLVGSSGDGGDNGEKRNVEGLEKGRGLNESLLLDMWAVVSPREEEFRRDFQRMFWIFSWWFGNRVGRCVWLAAGS